MNSAEKAFEVGCHVFLKKPIATKLDDARQITSVSETANQNLMIRCILHLELSYAHVK